MLQEDADPADWCVYRNEVHHTSKEKSVVLQVGGRCQGGRAGGRAGGLASANASGVVGAAR